MVSRLFAWVMVLVFAACAPAAWSAEHARTAHKSDTVSAAGKKKVKAGVKKRLKQSAKKKAVTKKTRKARAMAKKRHVVSEAQEGRLRMSHSLAAAPMTVHYGIAEAGDLELRSAAVLVIDQETGEALYAKNPDVMTPIASITKLMTSMVVLDAGLAMSEEISITDEDVDRLKYTGSRLAVGTRLTREELLNLALIASENRAAAALSRAYPGGREAFVRAMNRRAAVLGMTHTRFVDGTGLDSGNRATAADLAKLVEAAYSYPTIRRITSTGQYGVTVPGRRLVRVKENGKVRKVSREVFRHVAFNNTNALTRNPDWDIGVSKTGFINEAGHCLVMQANIAERPVIMVLLDSWGKLSRIGDAARVRKWLERREGGQMAGLGREQPV